MRRPHSGCSNELLLTQPRSCPASPSTSSFLPSLGCGSQSGIGICQGRDAVLKCSPPLPSFLPPCHTPALPLLLPWVLDPRRFLSREAFLPPKLHGPWPLAISHVTLRVPSLTIRPKGTCLPTPSLLTFHPNHEPQKRHSGCVHHVEGTPSLGCIRELCRMPTISKGSVAGPPLTLDHVVSLNSPPGQGPSTFISRVHSAQLKAEAHRE